MRVFDFDRAIVRAPARSVVDGLRSDPKARADYEEIIGEHAAYVAALRAAGLDVEILAPLEAYPDSMFVEDPALVFPEVAILLRPGAPSRSGESDEMLPVLKRRFPLVLELGADQFVDGGDILVMPDMVVIGVSARTNAAGANALRENLASLGRAARIVDVARGILHLKSGVSLLDEETVLMSAHMASTEVCAGFKTLFAPEEESASANAIRVNDTIFVGGCYPRTLDLLAKEGFTLVPLPVTEVAKLDAGLSCMSLRWHAPP